MPHRLDPLLRPKSIAIVGASARKGSLGNQVVLNLLKGKYSGHLYAVNPRYDDIEGIRCFSSPIDLPKPVEHVIFALSDARLEGAFDQAIETGAKAVTIYSALVLADDSDPPLKTRIQMKARNANLLICGGNGMGFYNFGDGIWNCGFTTRDHRAPGNVALISQSGSGMHGIVDVEGRIDFNLAVSTGQELTVTMADYLDFALDTPAIKVVGLFMETVRDVPAMTAALQKAALRKIPILAIKVGRTELAAKLAVSHTGAIAGNDDAYNAYFDRYGVMRVSDSDEMATAMIMFAQPHDVGPGGLVSMHDSGGVRQLVVDLADDYGATLTELNPASVAKLEETLEPELPAVNPLDSWSTGGDDFEERAAGYLTTMMSDPGAAVGAVIQDRDAGGIVAPEFVEYLRKAHDATGKPAFLVSGRQGTGTDPLAVEATREGLPVLDGVSPFLKGVKLLFDHRDFCQRIASTPPVFDKDIVSHWQIRLGKDGKLAEAEGAELLRDFRINALTYRQVKSADEAIDAAADLGYPVALKTAAEGIAHKSDQGGVRLNIKDADNLAQSYAEMSQRLGPNIYVTPMVTDPGVEMILGMISDDQFGPLVIAGFGGIYAETLKDVVTLLPPFGADHVLEKLGALRLAPLLAGMRGSPPVDAASFAEAAARFSILASALGDSLHEIDVNPVLVTASGCIALDALVVPHVANERKAR